MTSIDVGGVVGRVDKHLLDSCSVTFSEADISIRVTAGVLPSAHACGGLVGSTVTMTSFTLSDSARYMNERAPLAM